jgi:hypothetical protein
LAHQLLRAWIGVGGKRLVDLRLHGFAKFLAVGGKAHHAYDGRHHIADHAGDSADAHAHAGGDDRAGYAALIKPHRERSRAQQPQAEPIRQIRQYGEHGSGEARE